MSKMVNTGLLVLTNASKVAKILPVLNEYVLKTLYIHYFPEKNFVGSGSYLQSVPRPQNLIYSQTISHIYKLASTYSPTLDVQVLLSGIKNSSIPIINTKKPIEMVIFDQSYSENHANSFIQDHLANTSMGCRFITIDDKDTQEDDFQNAVDEQIYKNVVLGGTFDRLHNGHKILLSEAVLRCSQRLVVGVTDTNMLYSKILWELIEPIETRISRVREFLTDIDPSLTYDIVPINDMYGPTKDDPTFEMIVVSEETVRGGIKVNELRKQSGLNTLAIHVVNLEDDPHAHEHEESKISSSNARMRLLGSRLREPTNQRQLLKPYIIGLTGGIASGKTSVGMKLQNLGAGLVNCDQIAHELYAPGQRCFLIIVENFDKGILNSEGFIDRKALGDIVFKDKKQLDKLNNLVWPAILEEAQKQINKLYEGGCEIVVMEAAVLIRAGWQDFCHEIWTCIIPQAEAVNRLISRNALTEEEARLRIEAQPSNSEQISHAHVVISTLWSHEVTQKQVEKAWVELNSILNARSKS